MTKKYIGTKIITAWPQDKDGQQGYAVKYADGYTSWSPKDVFEEAYRQLDQGGNCLTFGDAIHMLKLGKRIMRAGWNGKGMWLRHIQPYAMHPDQGGVPPFCNPYFKAWDNNDQAEGTMLPWIGMKTADNGFVPWLASQTDVLAEDWVVID